MSTSIHKYLAEIDRHSVQQRGEAQILPKQESAPGETPWRGAKSNTIREELMQHLTEEELRERAAVVSNYGAEVKITGLWAWAVFAEKPRDEIRDEMKKTGWRWAKQKKAWYLPGKPCMSKRSHSFSYIKEKYGCEDVECTALARAA